LEKAEITWVVASLRITTACKEVVAVGNRRNVRNQMVRALWYSTLIACLLFVVFLIFKAVTSPTPTPNEGSPRLVTGAYTHSPYAFSHLFRGGPSLKPTGSLRRAAIVDQIGLLHPNRGFIDRASHYLTEAGFDVEVYEGEEVTIGLYRTLPTKGYGLIILQTHSSSDLQLPDGTISSANPVFLCSSEPYGERKYFYEQMTNQVRGVELPYEGSIVLCSIGPEFVRQSMAGNFDDALIIIGGCQGLSTLPLAEALIERGASAVISWDDWVDLSRNDEAIVHLLQALIDDRLTIEQAVERAMSEVGPDPTYNSVLTYFPQERGGCTIGDVGP